MWRKSVFDIHFTELGAVMTTVLPVLFKYCYKYCYSDSRKLWAVMKGGGLALWNLIQPTISLEMPVPSQGDYVFTVFRLLTDFVCLYTYEFWLSLCKIARSSVIVVLPLFKNTAVQWGDMWANPEVMNGKQTIYTDRMKINIKNMKLMNFIINIYCYFYQLKIKIDN